MWLTGEVTFDSDSLQAAGEGEATKGPPTFDLVAYNGGKMKPAGRSRPVVLEFSGISFDKNIPILLDHQPMGRSIVGHGEPYMADGKLKARGVVSAEGATEAAHTVITAARGGFPWKTSIGGNPSTKPQLVPAGSSKVVNGQRHEGPFDYIAKARLYEISFVPIGADSDTSATIAATKENPMADTNETTLEISDELQTWLEAKGVDTDDLDEKSLKGYEMAFKLEASATTEEETEEETDETDEIKASRAAYSTELKRRNSVETITAEYPELQIKAVGEGWEVEKAELEVLRAELQKQPRSTVQSTRTSDISNDVIECRMLMTEDVDPDWLQASGKHWKTNVEHSGYSEETIDKASNLPEYTFGRLFREFLTSNGVSYSAGATTSEILPLVKDTNMKIKASSTGFSTINVTGILSNVMGKRLLAAFEEVPPVAQRVSANRSVPDFKETKAFRMTGNGDFLPLGDAEELQSMQLQEEVYSNRPRTYGRIIRATRQMLINDDLGALTSIPRVLGRKAALKLQQVFFDVWESLEASNFFSSGNNNLITDKLAIAGLTAGETAFLSLEDADGDPIAVEAETLLVPQDLKVTAEELMASTSSMIYDRDTAASGTTRGPVTNPHVGKWNIEWTPWLRKAATSAGTANGATAWYLIAPPSIVPAAEIVYLNGRNTPTIEGEDAAFDVLGMQWRGYWDFGVKEQDFRGAVKSDGTV